MTHSRRAPARAGPAPGPALDPKDVEVWLFDLDNTLYPASCRLFDQIELRMGAFIAELLSLEWEAARSLQKRYFREHGTTMAGLIAHHGVDPQVYMDYVHAVDLSPIAPSPALDAALDALPGRKLIFTNASTRHAARVMERLGVTRHFEAVFDIVAADFKPKPAPESYDALLARHAVDPRRAVFFEDSARNLAPAAALGMTTVWVAGDHDWAREADQEDYVHHVAEDLADWLAALAARARPVDRR